MQLSVLKNMPWKELLAKLGRNKPVLAIIGLALVTGASLGWYYNNNRSTPQKTGVDSSDLELIESIPQPLEKFEDFGLTIEKLKISAPIVPQVDGFNEKIYYGALKKGVGQFKDSSTPDKTGNLFIFGHSSWFPGVVGKYTEVFLQLNELKKDDEFIVYYQKTPYKYKVTKSYLTTDQDWTLIDPTPDNKDDKTVTLMTCWPPGTTAKRWGVVATQI